MSNLLYTVHDIFNDSREGYLIKESKEYFNIPVYQRGYKWKPLQVRKLLVDINNFQPEGDKFYCLQNITIVPDKELPAFSVVDGQQRLTTLVVLLSYLDKKELVKGKVRFPHQSIREETNKFINDIIIEDEGFIEDQEWDTFIKHNPNFDHQDIFYLFSAYQTIDRWFKESKIDTVSFANKLLSNVRLIVNNISDDSKEEKIFGNLNSKRIPLDGADLVRAILITRVAYEEGKRDFGTDIKNIVRVNERRVRIGWELDEINNWWSKREVKSYYRRFVSIKSDEINEGNKLFKDDKFPINNLLLLFAEKSGKDKLTLEFIEERNNNALELYKEIIKLHTTLKDWFQDKEIYHYLGFLFAQSRIKFKEVWDTWNGSAVTRKQFIIYLKGKMKDVIQKADEILDLQNEDINWYDDQQDKLIKILVLLDVIWSVRENNPLLPSSAFERYGNDIEHIFPQNPKEIKDKKGYIHFLNTYVLKTPNKKIIDEFDSKYDDLEFQKKVEEFISRHTSEIKIHSIGNLVLLNAAKNRSIGNNPYAKKRAALVDDVNNGIFMRPHTLKVFVRYFDNGKTEHPDTAHWTNIDIEANAGAIQRTLTTFLN
jgi:uncharacterized protein with ParB-like and HNH nuclease domain